MRFLVPIPFLALFLSTPAAAQSAAAERPVLRDLNQDGLPDLYSVGSGRDDVLLSNLGDGRFVDVTAEAGLAGLRSRAMEPGDFDRDGHTDLLLVSDEDELRLFRGLEGGAFAEATDASLDAPVGQAEWTDYDLDGWDDLRVETTNGDTVFFHNLGGLGFEKIELGLGTLASESDPSVVLELAAETDEAGVGAPANAPTSAPTNAPGMGKGPASSSPGGRKLVMPVDVSLVTGGTTGADILESQIDLVCAQAIRDIGNGGSCMSASSLPTMGMLYPISQNWFIEPGTGNVGLGTTTPAARLDVAGAAVVSGGLTVSGSELDVLDYRLRLIESGSGFATVVANPTGPSNGGYFQMRTDDNFPTIELGADAGFDEGLMILRDANSSSGVSLRGRDVPGSGEGGAVNVFNMEGQATGRLIADDGNESGRLDLRNEAGANSHVGASLSASDASNAGRLQLRNNFGGLVVDLHASSGDTPTNTSRLALNEHDGSEAFEMNNDLFSASNSAGVMSFSLDRQSGVVNMFNDAGDATALLIGDDGDSGRLELRNEDGGNSHAGASLSASNGSNAGQLLLRNNFGGTVVTLRANNGNNPTRTSLLALDEHDGSEAFGMSNDTLRASGSSGVVNFSVDRHSGDVAQSLNGFGAVKAACRIDGTGASATVTNQVNAIPGGSDITVVRQAVGLYLVFIGTDDVSDRFFQATVDFSTGVTTTVVSVRPSVFGNNEIEVACYSPGSGTLVDADFYLMVY